MKSMKYGEQRQARLRPDPGWRYNSGGDVPHCLYCAQLFPNKSPHRLLVQRYGYLGSSGRIGRPESQDLSCSDLEVSQCVRMMRAGEWKERFYTPPEPQGEGFSEKGNAGKTASLEDGQALRLILVCRRAMSSV